VCAVFSAFEIILYRSKLPVYESRIATITCTVCVNRRKARWSS